jgi:ferritin-like metal-binding protein YciE
MKLTTLEKLLEDQLKDLYSAEGQILKALPKMAKTASNAALREGIEQHIEETKGQVERLQQIAEIMGIKISGKKCKGLEGTARTLAQQLGQDEVAELLQETLEEEAATDEKLTELAESEIYPSLMEEQKEEGMEEEEEEMAASSRGRRR